MISGLALGIDARFCLFRPSFVHRFLISSPNLRIDAGFCLGMVSPAPVPAAPRVPRPILLFVAAKENGPPATAVAATIFRVRFKFLCSKEERPACSVHGGNVLPHPILIFVTAKKNGPPATTSLLHGRTARRQNDLCGRRRGQDATEAA